MRLKQYNRKTPLVVGDYICLTSKLVGGLCTRPVPLVKITTLTVTYETPNGEEKNARRTSIMFVGDREVLSAAYSRGWNLTVQHLAERDALSSRHAKERKTLVGRLFTPEDTLSM